MVDAILGAMLADSNSPRILSQMLDTNSPTAAAIAAATGVGAGSVSMSDMHGVSDMSSLNQRQLNQLGRQLGQMLSQSGQLAEALPSSLIAESGVAEVAACSDSVVQSEQSVRGDRREVQCRPAIIGLRI